MNMASLFWPITLGVPAVVAVVAVIVIFFALGQKKQGKLDKMDQHDGVIQELQKSGKKIQRAHSSH